LLILLAFFCFRELRERRTRRKASRGAVTAPAAGSYYSADEEPDDLQPLRPRKPSSSVVAPVEGNELQGLEPLALRPAARTPVEEDDYDEATVVPLRFDDNEATYRLHQAIDLPLLGTLVRVTNDPNLPQQLPVYGLNPGPGEARQIHIGRHSKNNTVVINDKSISREHAVIIQKDGRLYLRDNASTAGTYLNWRQLKPGEELLLRHSDLISFGEIVYEFRNKGEDEATVANG
jgi:pSer/pThr/pTyr-binding forkhead associated (FHA) protein